jgi:DDE domain
VTDRALALRAVIEELIPAAFHNTEQYANNRIEADHGRLKARLRPMRGRKRDDTARVIMRGDALMQNIRRGHYELRCLGHRRQGVPGHLRAHPRSSVSHRGLRCQHSYAAFADSRESWGAPMPEPRWY